MHLIKRALGVRTDGLRPPRGQVALGDLLQARVRRRLSTFGGIHGHVGMLPQCERSVLGARLRLSLPVGVGLLQSQPADLIWELCGVHHQQVRQGKSPHPQVL